MGELGRGVGEWSREWESGVEEWESGVEEWESGIEEWESGVKECEAELWSGRGKRKSILGVQGSRRVGLEPMPTRTFVNTRFCSHFA